MCLRLGILLLFSVFRVGNISTSFRVLRIMSVIQPSHSNTYLKRRLRRIMNVFFKQPPNRYCFFFLHFIRNLWWTLGGWVNGFLTFGIQNHQSFPHWCKLSRIWLLYNLFMLAGFSTNLILRICVGVPQDFVLGGFNDGSVWLTDCTPYLYSVRPCGFEDGVVIQPLI